MVGPTRIGALAVLLVGVSVNFSVSAAIVKITADEFPLGGLITTNAEARGLRLSPNCHYDNFDPANPAVGTTSVLYADTSACSGRYNADFLGPPSLAAPGARVSYLYFDFGGNPFSLLELEFEGGGGRELISSKGSTFVRSPLGYSGGFWTQSFGGGDWSGIKYVMWEGCGCGAPSFGIRSLTFRVPEPGTLALLSLGLLGLGFTARRRLH